jgi:hypothetical protein
LRPILNYPLPPHPAAKWPFFKRLPDGRRSIHDITKGLLTDVRKQSTCRRPQCGGRSREARSGELLFPFCWGYVFIVRQMGLMIGKMTGSIFGRSITPSRQDGGGVGGAFHGFPSGFFEKAGYGGGCECGRGRPHNGWSTTPGRGPVCWDPGPRALTVGRIENTQVTGSTMSQMPNKSIKSTAVAQISTKSSDHAFGRCLGLDIYRSIDSELIQA